MFILWMTQLMKKAYLSGEDRLVYYMDKVSFDYLMENSVFGVLCDGLPCPHQIIIIPQPMTLLEGMMWKYNPCPYDQSIFMYCDIDIFILQPLELLLDGLLPYKLYVHAEGELADPDYGAALSPEIVERLGKGAPGLSAGKFIVTNQTLRDELFQQIRSLHSPTSNWYTVEQPLFNAAALSIQDTLDTDLLTIPVVARTIEEFHHQKTILLDFAGEPGDGELHWKHMYDAYCLLHAGLL
jgi:hypothetical protein